MKLFLFCAGVSVAVAASVCVSCKIPYEGHPFLKPDIQDVCKKDPCSILLYSISTPYIDKAIKEGNKSVEVPKGKRPTWQQVCEHWDSRCKAIASPYGPDAMTSRCFQEADSMPGSKYLVIECTEKRTPKHGKVEWVSWNNLVGRLEPWLFLATPNDNCPAKDLLPDNFCVGEQPDGLRRIIPKEGKVLS